MNEFIFKISTPDGNPFEGNVFFLSVRGSEGELAIMAGHIPFVTTVKAGSIKVELADGTINNWQIDDGLLTVTTEKVVLITGACS